jgi:DNA adenine methylase
MSNFESIKAEEFVKVAEIDKDRAKPFLKWVGGKTQLLPELTAKISQDMETYFEPFLGGGALFFHRIRANSILLDCNQELTNTYNIVKNQVDDLIEDLKQHIFNHEYYYRIRNVDRTKEYESWSAVKKASRLIYLNKTCFNGLYRVNSKGQFNTPIGRYKNPKIVDEENLRACSQALQKAQVLTGSFLDIEDKITKNDFVYFDPPYAPLNDTSSFTTYTQDGFDATMQLNLRSLCDRLNAKGIRFMVSNSNAPLILDLYKDYKIDYIYATRAINSKGDRRGKIPEVIITNY